MNGAFLPDLKSRSILPHIEMKKILFLTTGGTISCVATEDGLEPSLSGNDILTAVPELRALGEITVKDLTKIDSSNVVPSDWSSWATLIGDNYTEYDGFVLTHGTDTMAYTASALSYMLVNLGKPVVLTGSQVPLSLSNSDARSNLELAFTIASSGLPGVLSPLAIRSSKATAAKRSLPAISMPLKASMKHRFSFLTKTASKRTSPTDGMWEDSVLKARWKKKSWHLRSRLDSNLTSSTTRSSAATRASSLNAMAQAASIQGGIISCPPSAGPSKPECGWSVSPSVF